MIQHPIYFISDAHFGISLEGQNYREQHFFNWLDMISSSVKELYIVGDLFDFWIEYKHAIRPDYFNVLHHLAYLIERGITVHYIAGNHDFALGNFLKNTLGIKIYCGHVDTEIQGKKVHLYHGDGLIKKDIGYRLLRKVLRNKFNQRIYRLIHPNIGVVIGTFCSGSSRKYLRPRLLDSFIKEYREHGHRFLKKGNDIVIFGHSHFGEIIQFDCGTYCNTGAWLTHYNFASMHEGKIHLWSYAPGNPLQEIAPIDTK